VTGDTVGDPFKDTSGPSMNILIKLTCLVGLVIAPMLAIGDNASNEPVQGHGSNVEQVEVPTQHVQVVETVELTENR
jgi:K(+)-stimulated pyrophosphate-energized sodium pump